jgi:hypothetical protein
LFEQKEVEGLMATREHRLAEFATGTPAIGPAHQLLCEDHAGTYSLPYPCVWSGQQWINADTSAAIEARIVGWRLY